MFSQAIMSFVSLGHLSLQFKIYLLVLHTVVLGLIVHVLITVFDMRTRTKVGDGDQISKNSSGVRTVYVDGKRVTVESCHWINTILNWLNMNASNTPDLVKIWLTMLNEKLKSEKSSLKCKINGIVPGSLPPKFTNVYCSNACGTSQCIALHIETTRLGFYITLCDNNNSPAKSSDVEVNITKLSGELIFQVLVRQSHYDLTVKFIGDPELKVSSNDISEDGERSAVEEKLKEVICKTVVNIPLTDGKPSDENSVVCSVPQSSSSCVDLEGKLLVKVIKASGLTGKEGTDIPDVYCVITCREPRQKKKTISIKGSKDPFWNESHVLDISKKTKEIAFDVYNELKTLEGKKFHLNDYSEKSSDADSDFLGQVIVPLAMITKDQSCRLILPILPISMKSSYVTGQINLEFTYDKDGKAFETNTQSQTSSSKSAKTTIVANEVADVEETIQRSPQKVVFSMATLDIVEDEDDQFHFEPLEDHGIGREDIVMAEQRVSAGLPPTTGGHVGSENDDILVQENEKHDEMLQELIELDSRTTSKNHAKNEVKPRKAERKDDNERPPSTQSKQSWRATSPSSPCQITITPASEQSLSSPTSPVDTVDERGAPVQLDETLMEDLTPDTRRKVFRQAFSMRIKPSPEPSNLPKEEGEKPSSTFESRHSFSAGDKITPKTKSGSDVSLTSLYEGTKSILVVESKDRGEVKYHQIPPLMAKRGTFDHKGTKLHICNDHLFVAKHFGGSLPSCSVCESPLTGYFGKQGYVCRDCKMITHKRCHLETNSVCPNSTLASLKIKKAASIYGYK